MLVSPIHTDIVSTYKKTIEYDFIPNYFRIFAVVFDEEIR